MHCSHWRPHILCGLAVVLLSGCHWYSPYGYPGTYAPPGTIMPQQTFPGAPPATFPQSPPALAPGGSPNSTFQAPTTPGSGNNPAQLWNGSSSPGNRSEKPVPQPNDFGNPNDLQGPPGASRNEEDNSSPFTQMRGQREEFVGVNHADVSTSGSDDFLEPRPLDPEAARRGPNGAPIPYGHDEAGYTWLAGRVDHDKNDDSWHITYDLAPPQTDRLGGAVRLAPHEGLSKLRDGDIVRVVGELDYDQRDPGGKAQYRITSLDRIIPKANSPVAN